MAVPSFLSWSESPITFDQRDHPSHVARPGRYPLVVDPIVHNILDILNIDTLDAMRIPQSELRLVGSAFHGVILRAQAYLLRQINLPVMFGNQANFRSEVLTFEVVDFLGSYHAILGRPCYAKFMAIPNYTYLKLKMLGPNGVITVGSTFSHAYMCDREHFELATTVINSTGKEAVPASLRR